MDIQDVTASGASCATSAQVVTCNLDPLAPLSGTSIQLTLKGTLANNSAAANFQNTASDAYANDPNPANNTAVAGTLVQRTSDLQVTAFTATPLPGGSIGAAYTPGVHSSVAYSVTLTNTGPDSATNINLQIAFPTNSTNITVGPGCIATANSISCSVAELAATGSTTLSYSLTPDTSGSTTQFASAAAVSSALIVDPQPQNNTLNNSVMIRRSGDISLNVTPDKTKAVIGPHFGEPSITFTAQLHNNGSTTANDVHLLYQAPGGWTFGNVSPGCQVTGQN